MEKRIQNYLKAINVNFIIINVLFAIETGYIILMCFLCFIFKFFDPYLDIYYIIFWNVVLFIFMVFNIIYIIFEDKSKKCMSLVDKRKIYLIHSIFKLIPSVILFLFSIIINIYNYIDLIFLIIHSFIFVLSIASLVLCLLCKNIDTIEKKGVYNV